ncbi:MAG: lipoyl synthase [Candidatus Omnitrophica bacterium]|nr:lipoyl synthase [Candidatus Omnitrophota bacterium]MBU1870232.1 lipoyl synthase [Candidatus Omnitrophota bacterium]
MKRPLPEWFKEELSDTNSLKLRRLFSEFGINTVCRQVKCSNLSYCFKHKKVAFMILGERCTRNCSFCFVKKPDGSALSVDRDEAERIARITQAFGLAFVVITSVTRDDLEDGGSRQFQRVIKLIKAVNKEVKIEAVTPDFEGRVMSLKTVLEAKPDILGHNIHTVKRLYKQLRPMADYQLSLDILEISKELAPDIKTKSSIMLGLGEEEDEVTEAMEDLRKSRCDILTIGQYFAPSADHYPVKEFIDHDTFKKYKSIATFLGFKAVLSGPRVRSSVYAQDLYKELEYA